MTPTHPRVVSYDFARPPLLTPPQATALRGAAAAVAQTLAFVVSGYLGRELGVSVVAAKERLGEEEGVQTNSAWLCPAGGESSEGPVWRFDWPLASAAITLMLGGRCQQDTSSSRDMTRLEAALLARMAEQLHGAWAASWPVKSGPAPPWQCSAEAPRRLLTDGAYPVVVRYDVRGEEIGGACDLYLPPDLLPRPPVRRSPRPALPSEITNPGVRAVSVPVRVVLGSWRTTLRELLALRVGEIVPLQVAAEETLPLYIAGLEKMHVRAGLHGGRVAVQVTALGQA